MAVFRSDFEKVTAPLSVRKSCMKFEEIQRLGSFDIVLFIKVIQQLYKNTHRNNELIITVIAELKVIDLI